MWKYSWVQASNYFEVRISFLKFSILKNRKISEIDNFPGKTQMLLSSLSQMVPMHPSNSIPCVTRQPAALWSENMRQKVLLTLFTESRLEILWKYCAVVKKIFHKKSAVMSGNFKTIRDCWGNNFFGILISEIDRNGRNAWNLFCHRALKLNDSSYLKIIKVHKIRARKI